jgi:hypothetical protein
VFLPDIMEGPEIDDFLAPHHRPSALSRENREIDA